MVSGIFSEERNLYVMHVVTDLLVLTHLQCSTRLAGLCNYPAALLLVCYSESLDCSSTATGIYCSISHMQISWSSTYAIALDIVE